MEVSSHPSAGEPVQTGLRRSPGRPPAPSRPPASPGDLCRCANIRIGAQRLAASSNESLATANGSLLWETSAQLGTARSSRAHSAGLRPALRVRGFRDASHPDSSHAIFACGAGDRVRLLSVSDLHDHSYSLRGIGEFPGKTSINIG